MRLLDGNRIRDEIKSELRPRIEFLAAQRRPPGLAVILVGDHPASRVYVSSKTKTCAELGIASETIRPPESIITSELITIIDDLNARPDVDGILVQLPLPPHVSTPEVLLSVAPEKDVDGFHPCNVGNLVSGRSGPRPCTPAGIIELLKRYQIAMARQKAVVVGRSDIVGKPIAILLLHEDATVTICHSKTRDLAEVCRGADLLIAAIGRPGLIRADFIKPGATVVDVGINRVSDARLAEDLLAGDAKRLIGFQEKGSVLVGDVHPGDAAQVAGAYTPVPGGVGPLTIAMLMANTVASAEHRLGLC